MEALYFQLEKGALDRFKTKWRDEVTAKHVKLVSILKGKHVECVKWKVTQDHNVRAFPPLHFCSYDSKWGGEITAKKCFKKAT